MLSHAGDRRGGNLRPWVDTHKRTATARISRAPLGDTGRDAVSVGVQYITPGGGLQVRRGKGAENHKKTLDGRGENVI